MPAREPIHEESLTREAIRSLQERAWREAYAYAFARSPFYREHLRRAGLAPERPPALDDLGIIPPVTKSELSARNAEFLCVPPERMKDVVTTSGTTGAPLLWQLTESDLERLAYNEWLSFRCAGLTAADTVLLGVTLDRCFIAGLAYFLGLRMLGCRVVRIGAGVPVMHLEFLRSLRPAAVVSVPSFLRVIADKARETGVDLAAAGVKRLVCIGEPVREPDGSLNPAGRALAEAWGARVISTYGNTEIEGSLCECEAGRGNHAHPELMHVECLDDQDRPVPPGETGELTVTTFGVEGMPLIRYRTGDLAWLDPAPCACGRATPRLGPVLGRRDQKLKLKGTTLFPGALQAVLDARPDVRGYVIVAESDDALSDRVRILVRGGEPDPRRLLAALREDFAGKAKVVPDLQAATESEIEALQFEGGARKRRLFVDRRNPR
jgi:phenylacetate-CoA ligase